jgi:putative addiction module CopG family antidote
MSVTLTARQEKLVANLVETGRYHNRGEVVRTALRLLEEHEVKAQESALDDFLRVRDAEPGFTPTAKDWAEMRKRVRARVNQHRNAQAGR